MSSLADSLADGVLADAILIPPHPAIPPTNIRKVGVLEKSMEIRRSVEDCTLHADGARLHFIDYLIDFKMIMLYLLHVGKVWKRHFSLQF